MATTSPSIWHITDTIDQNAKIRLDSAYRFWTQKMGFTNSAAKITYGKTTLEIGTILSEIVNDPHRLPETLVAVNCAGPSKKNDGLTKGNARENFYCFRLKGGITVVGTCNLYELSYVRDLIEEAYELETTNANQLRAIGWDDKPIQYKDQFRSLYVLPQILTRFGKNPAEPGLLSGDGSTLWNSFEQHERDSFTERGITVNHKIKKLPWDKQDTDLVAKPNTDSHTFRVDNFGNVGIYFSDQDMKILAKAKAENKKVKISFALASLEVGGWRSTAFWWPWARFTANLNSEFFGREIDTFNLAEATSSRRTDGRVISQAIHLRRNAAAVPPWFYVPQVGARVKLKIV